MPIARNVRWVSIAAFGALLSISGASPVRAAGPLLVTAAGTPYRWALPIPYNPDRGPLGARTNAQATTDVANDFAVWAAVPTANLVFRNAGALPVDVDANCPSPSCWQNFLGVCGDGLSPIIYDVDGAITDDVFGTGANNSILGFAGPECANASTATITEGSAVLNGRWLDGVETSSNREISLMSFNAVFVHEFGHYVDLDHSQINLTEAFDGVSANDDAIATMFPILVNGGQMSSLNLDDRVSVSTLYPAASFASSTGTLAGTILRSDATPFQGAYVVARKVGDPRLTAVGVVSGQRYTAGSSPAALKGRYEIPGLPPGDYTVEIEAIDPSFTGGSSVGPLDPPAALPGPPEFWNGADESGTSADDPAQAQAIAVGAGTEIAGIDIVMNGAAPAATPKATATRSPVATATPAPGATVACAAAPVASCIEAARLRLESNELRSGHEHLKLQWRSFAAATSQAAFGDPVRGATRVALCLYDDGKALVQGFAVDRAGVLCAGKPCWQPIGVRGWRYKDALASASGIASLGYLSGAAKAGHVDVSGTNDASRGKHALPTGVAARLAGNVAPTAQLVTSDGLCIGAAVTHVTRDVPGVYEARR